MSEFTTLKTYSSSITANIELQRLRLKGIDCYLISDSMYKNTFGDVILRVARDQVDEAIRILETDLPNTDDDGASPE